MFLELALSLVILRDYSLLKTNLAGYELRSEGYPRRRSNML